MFLSKNTRCLGGTNLKFNVLATNLNLLVHRTNLKQSLLKQT